MRRLSIVPLALLIAATLALAGCRNTEEQVQPSSPSPGVNPSVSPTVESISPTSAAEAYGPSGSASPDSGGSTTGSGGPGSCTRDDDGEVKVVAKSLSFDTSCISISVGSNTRVELDNRDGTAHTFSVYEGQDEVLKGDPTPAGEDRTYRLPTLQPGSYRFQCDIHPSMRGTLRVT